MARPIPTAGASGGDYHPDPEAATLNILSIQSWVAYGHVGNASAAFPLQRLGAEVWAINTVQFSNHTGYGAWTGDVFTGASVRALVDGIEARGVLPGCDAVLSGYMGARDVGEAILHAAARVRSANPRALYCCDPVIGDDDTGEYVRPGIAELMRDKAIPAADVATPNAFELRRLTGLPCGTLDEAVRAVRALQTSMRPGGARTVLLTSLRTEQTPDGSIDMLAGGPDALHLLRTPMLPVAVNGAGDAIAALFLLHLLRSGSPAEALRRAGSSIHGVLRRTAEAGSRELLTVAAQDELERPSTLFEPTRI